MNLLRTSYVKYKSYMFKSTLTTWYTLSGNISEQYTLSRLTGNWQDEAVAKASYVILSSTFAPSANLKISIQVGLTDFQNSIILAREPSRSMWNSAVRVNTTYDISCMPMYVNHCLVHAIACKSLCSQIKVFQ